MKKTQLLLVAIITALMSLATISCQKEVIVPPDNPSDTTDTPDEPEVDNYIMHGTDTFYIHHVAKEVIDREDSLGEPVSHHMYYFYLKDHPDTWIFVAIDNFMPGPNPTPIEFGITQNNTLPLKKSMMTVNILNNGLYKIDFADTYQGEAFEIHFVGHIYEIDKPAGEGKFTMNGITSTLNFNECDEVGPQYYITFNNPSTTTDHTFLSFIIDSQLLPGTYNLDDKGFLLLTWNGAYLNQHATNGTLTANRNGDNWELHATGTLPDGDFEFTYSGYLNCLYLNED